MLLSKMVVRRKRNARNVAAAMKVHGAAVAEQLDALFAPLRSDKDPPPAYALTFSDLARLLELRREEMEQADWVHLNELADDRRLRQERDEAAARLHRTLVRISNALDGSYGVGEAEGILGLGAGLRSEPEQMYELGRRVVGQLLDPGFTLPPPSFGNALEAAALAAEVTADLEPLGAAIEQLSEEKRKFDQSLKLKREAISRFDVAYGQGANWLKAMFLMVGEAMLASRIRPSAPSSGSEEGDGEGGDDGSGDGGGEDGGGDAPDGPLPDAPSAPAAPAVNDNAPAEPARRVVIL